MRNVMAALNMLQKQLLVRNMSSRNSLDQCCANPNPNSDLNPDSRLFELDSDSESGLKNINPDSDSIKKVMDSSLDSNFWVPITTYYTCKNLI